jgi:predicted DNA-binding transcriptional regulator AlpA
MSYQDDLHVFSSIRPAMLERVDSILLALAGRHFEMTRDIASADLSAMQKHWSAEALRKSPFGLNLLIVASYVNPHYSWQDSQEVEQAMQRLLRMAYGDPFREGYTVPAKFHETELGKLFQDAYVSMYRPKELMTIRQVYEELGTAKQSVYDRIADGKLHPIYYYQEIRLLRQEVEEWKAQREQRKKSKGSRADPPSERQSG